ncbi:Hypothetical predicted protein [Xyrichtys novacula]|uniref:Uncharacterized protein n=1 Tax=Xyrichtys novacula TaxID=13765 RepID=A0AAV1FVU4_XYRNO|nr:Hypothetical predicted protein [Xyrichtys novacula]
MSAERSAPCCRPADCKHSLEDLVIDLEEFPFNGKRVQQVQNFLSGPGPDEQSRTVEVRRCYTCTPECKQTLLTRARPIREQDRGGGVTPGSAQRLKDLDRWF